jgi:hypothetical protein
MNGITKGERVEPVRVSASRRRLLSRRDRGEFLCVESRRGICGLPATHIVDDGWAFAVCAGCAQFYASTTKISAPMRRMVEAVRHEDEAVELAGGERDDFTRAHAIHRRGRSEA